MSLFSFHSFRDGKSVFSTVCFISFLILFVHLGECIGYVNDNWMVNAEEKINNHHYDYDEENPIAELKMFVKNELKKMNDKLMYLDSHLQNGLKYMDRRIDRFDRKVGRNPKKNIPIPKSMKMMADLEKVDINMSMSYIFSNDQHKNSSEELLSEKLPIKKIQGTNLYTGVYYQIGMKSFPKGWVTLSNQTEDQEIRYPIIDNKMDTSRSVNSQWMFEETENEGWYTLNNRGIPNGLATWSSTKRGSGYHLSMTMSEYQAISGDKGNVLWRPEPSNQENFYSIKMKDFPLGIVTWTYDKYDNDSHYLIVATKTEDMVNYLPGEKWYDDKLFNFHSPRLW